jgi:hypothetical protein
LRRLLTATPDLPRPGLCERAGFVLREQLGSAGDLQLMQDRRVHERRQAAARLSETFLGLVQHGFIERD